MLEKSKDISNKVTIKILNFAIIMWFLATVYYFFKVIVYYIPIFLGYLVNLTSRIDAIIMVALITGGISLANSIYSKYSENKNRRREYLSSKREEPYSKFIEVIFKITQIEGSSDEYNYDEILKDFKGFSAKLTLWGSPKVVEKYELL